MALAEGANRFEVVERPGGGAAGRGDDGHDPAAIAAQALEFTLERVDVHPESDGPNHDRPLRSQAEFSDRSGHAVVRVFPAHDDRRVRSDAVRPHVGHHGLSGREEARERRLGTAGGEGAAGVRAEAGEVAHPADDLRLDDGSDRRHLPDRARLIDRCGQRLGPDGHGERRRHLVAHRSRVSQAVAVGQDVALESSQHVFDAVRVGGKRLVEAAGEFLGRKRRRYGPAAATSEREVTGHDARERLGNLEARVVFDIGEDGVVGHAAGMEVVSCQ